MDKNHQAVANTSLLVAAIRASESERDDPLFSDPFAWRLAGERGRELFEEAEVTTRGLSSAQIVVRTRFWDESLLQAVRDIHQVVIIAAGMDARAFRLQWPDGTTIYELDQPQVVAAKAELLADVQPQCSRVELGIDVTDDWPSALRSAGLDSAVPTVWLIEGLLQYLPERVVRTLFARIDAESAPGSVLLYDVVGQVLLESVPMAGLLDSMAKQGAPWLFGTDEPKELAERHRWSATVTDLAEAGNRYGRWYAPAAPLDVQGVPRGYFVTATK